MDKRIFFLLNRAQHRLYKYADSQSETRAGLSVTQAAVVMFLAKNEGCLQKEVAAATGMNQPAVTGLVSRMVNNGLVETKACPQDGRASRLYLTATGLSKLPMITPMVKELNRQLSSDFSAQEVEVIVRFLNNVIAKF